jgi:hypothetical protein
MGSRRHTHRTAEGHPQRPHTVMPMSGSSRISSGTDGASPAAVLRSMSTIVSPCSMYHDSDTRTLLATCSARICARSMSNM